MLRTMPSRGAIDDCNSRRGHERWRGHRLPSSLPLSGRVASRPSSRVRVWASTMEVATIVSEDSAPSSASSCGRTNKGGGSGLNFVYISVIAYSTDLFQAAHRTRIRDGSLAYCGSDGRPGSPGPSRADGGSRGASRALGAKSVPAYYINGNHSSGVSYIKLIIKQLTHCSN